MGVALVERLPKGGIMVPVLIGPLLPAEPGPVVFVWLDAVAVKYVCVVELIYEVELSELV